MNEKQKKLKKLSKGKKSSWTKDAEFRVRNRKWLTYSSNIARRILAALEDKENVTQKKLATTINVSPQYICKVVKGRENLSLETIAKISTALNVELITFPAYKYSGIAKPESSNFWIGVKAFAFAMNKDDPNYNQFHNFLSIDTDTVLVSQNEISHRLLPFINPNIEKKVLDSENFSLIKQTSQNG